jgi:hypothetical protein
MELAGDGRMNMSLTKSKVMGDGCRALTIGALVLLAPCAKAEDNAQFRTAVSFTGGLSVGSLGGPGGFAGTVGERFGFGRRESNTAFALGGTISRDVTPRLTVEANGSYLDRQSGAWSADAGIRLNLVPSSRPLVPYVAVSGGVMGGSTAHLDLDGIGHTDQELMGYVQSHLPQFGPGGRIEDAVAALRTAIQQAPDVISGGSYTNGMVTMGGGVRFDAGPHVFVRPDARAQVVFSNNARVVGLFTLNFGYRF